MIPHSLSDRLGLCLLAALAGANAAIAHHSYPKVMFNVETPVAGPWFNAKSNASTRGSATTEATQLYFMQSPRHHTGTRTAHAWHLVVQDQDVSTEEDLELSWVRYAANDVDPDETPSGVVQKVAVKVFGWPMSANAIEFIVLSRLPVDLPARYGIGVKLGAAPGWPNDGLSIHAQLNLPNDPLAPRVPAPFDQQVWTFERPGQQVRATPLGGRTLDTLEVGSWFSVHPMLQPFVVSTAYGGPPERLFGPESMHPVAARGDQLGFVMQVAYEPGGPGLAFFLLSPTLSAQPLRFSPAAGLNEVYLGFQAPFPVLLATGVPDLMTGRVETTPIPFASFPPGLRQFWVQALLLYPSTWTMRVTEAVGVQGL